MGKREQESQGEKSWGDSRTKHSFLGSEEILQLTCLVLLTASPANLTPIPRRLLPKITILDFVSCDGTVKCACGAGN